MIKELKRYIFITLGSFCLAFGVVMFLQANMLITGGTAGLALLISYFSPLSFASLIILINLPLLSWSYIKLGKQFVIRTIVCNLLIALFVELLTPLITPITYNLLLSSVFGGVIIGLGIGLVLYGDASAGGSTTVAQILSKQTNINASKIVLFFDAIIMISSLFIFDTPEKSLWSLISVYVTARCIDVILVRGPSKKVVHIVSDNIEVLNKKIVKSFGINGTLIQGDRLDFQSTNKIILMTIELKNLKNLKQIVQEHDKNAFIVVMEAYEILGRENS